MGRLRSGLELIRCIHSHDCEVSKKAIGVETAVHPSDSQVVTFVRRCFVAKTLCHLPGPCRGRGGAASAAPCPRLGKSLPQTRMSEIFTLGRSAGALIFR